MGLRKQLASAGNWMQELVTSYALVSVPDHPANGGLAGEANDYSGGTESDEETEDERER